MNNKSFEKSLSDATFIFRVFGLQYFVISSKNEPCSYKGNNISRKFKLYFVVLLIIILTLTGFLIWGFLLEDNQESESEKYKKAKNVGQLSILSMMVFMMFSVIHAYITTSDVKTILKHCAEIINIFESSMTFDSGFDCFGKAFKKFCFKFVTLFMACNLLLFIFTYIYEPERLIAVIFFEILPYCFIEVTVLRFIFSVMLVNHINQSINKFFQQKILANSLRKSFAFIETNELEKMISVKKVYGLTWKMTRLINKNSGPSMSVFFLLVVIGNSFAGYMMFLGTKGEVPFEEQGGLYFVFFFFKFLQIKVFIQFKDIFLSLS